MLCQFVPLLIVFVAKKFRFVCFSIFKQMNKLLPFANNWCYFLRLLNRIFLSNVSL